MTLQESLQTGFLSTMLAEAFASTIVANLHKDNPDTMNQFFRSLAKYKYSMQGCKDEFITETTVSDALKKNKSDKVLKIWMKGNKIGFFSVANTVIDSDFNWNGKTSPGKRDNSKVFGDPEIIEEAFTGTPWSKLGFTKVYMIAFSSLKALGQGKQPTEVVDPKTEEIRTWKPAEQFADAVSGLTLSGDVAKDIQQIMDKNYGSNHQQIKGEVYAGYDDWDTHKFDGNLYVVTKVGKHTWKDRWGCKQSVPDPIFAKLNPFTFKAEGGELRRKPSAIVIASNIKDFKNKKYLYLDESRIKNFKPFGIDASIPSANKDIPNPQMMVYPLISETPTAVLYCSNRRYYVAFSTSMSVDAYKVGDIRNEASKILGIDASKWDDSERLKMFYVPKATDKLGIHYMEVIPKSVEFFGKLDKAEDFEISNLAPALQAAISKAMGLDVDFIVYNYLKTTDLVTNDISNTKAAEEAAAAKKAEARANAAAAAEESNKKNSVLRNKAEAEAKKVSEKYTPIFKKIYAEIIKSAETYDDVLRIYNAHLKEFSAIPVDNKTEIDGVRVNTSGMYYVYDTFKGTYKQNYDAPAGVPVVAFKKSYHNDSYDIRIFNEWVAKGKPNDERTIGMFLPAVLMICNNSRTAIYSSGLVRLAGKNFMICNDQSHRYLGTMKFERFALATYEINRFSGSLYTLK